MTSIAEPIVFVPGLACDGRLFEPQCAALVAQGRECSIAEHDRDDTIAAIAQRLLAQAPRRFALCGLSMGGYIAFEVMRQSPERVTRLALLDTTADPPTEETNAPREQMIALASKGAFDNVVTLLWQRLVAPDRLADSELRLQVKAMAESVGADAFIRQQQAIMRRADSRPNLASIAVPTLVLVGSEDQITPPDQARAIAAGIGEPARLVMISGSGHLPTLEAPEATYRALAEWLAA